MKVTHINLISLGIVAFPILIMAKEKKTYPNIIIILTDDLGYGDTNCYGGINVKTPNIDQLAKEGIRFTNGYAVASTSSPSRYSLLTGEYAWRKNIGILDGDAAMAISKDAFTLPSMLQKKNYTTACIGKWHLGLGEGKVDFNKYISPSPNDIGFDYSFIIPATNDRVPCVYVENGLTVGLDASDPIQVNYETKIGDWPTGKENPELLRLKSLNGHNQTIVNGISRIGFMTGGKSALWVDEDMSETLTSKAISFIKRNSKNLFFLYFATHNIHEPRVPGKNFKGSSNCGVYGDVIQECDWSVGEILKALKESNIDDNTLIIFLSDNGPMVAEGYADNGLENINGHKAAGNLRGGKYSLYEGGTRTPFIVKWPKKITPSVSNSPVTFIDLFASLASLVGVKLNEKQAPDSKNMLAILMGKTKKAKNTEILIQDNLGNIALRKGDWKLIPKECTLQKKSDELYNLRFDISESNNLSLKHPEIVKTIYDRLIQIKSSKLRR